MIITAGLRPWFRAAALLAVLVGTAGLVLGLGAGPAGAGQTASTISSEEAQAKPHLIVHSDFPSGWSGQGKVTTSDSGGSFPGAGQLAACLGVSPSLINAKTPQATSPNFQNKAGTDYVQDSVSVFRSSKQGTQEYAAIADPKVPSCLTEVLATPAAKQQLQQSAGSGVTIGTVTVTATNPAVLVPHSSGFTISFPATSQGITANSSVSVVSIVRGKLGSQVSFTSVGLPFPVSLERHLVSVASGRT
jgi:hypothetical protein